MKKVAKDIFYTALLSGMVIILIGYIHHIFFFNNVNVHNETLDDLLTQLEDKSSPHPYGKPVYGFLNWEDDSSFLDLCGQYGAILRMAAFQTTLPDPLPGEKYNVALAADLLAGAVVKPGEFFFLNKVIGSYTRERGFKEGPAYSGNQVVSTVGGGVCKIATTLYNVTVLANLKISERHAHGMLVPYVPPGQDATIVYGVKDFSFRNNTEHPLVIWANTEGDTLTIAIYGSTYPPKVTWHHELLSWQKRHTIYRNNTNLHPGEEQIIIPGADGVTVKSWLTIEYPDGTLITKDLGIDYYKPMPRVVEKIILE
jgi:hypothetical protein